MEKSRGPVPVQPPEWCDPSRSADEPFPACVLISSAPALQIEPFQSWPLRLGLADDRPSPSGSERSPPLGLAESRAGTGGPPFRSHLHGPKGGHRPKPPEEDPG